MSEVTELITTIKRQLKARGMTYVDVAKALDLSEPSVKRLFSNERFTVERLVQLSHLLNMSLTDLMQLSAAGSANVYSLSPADELKLVSDPAFFVMAVCVLNHWSVSDIVSVYRLSDAECAGYLLELQAMGLITVLPGNNIRLRIARDFVWLSDGPIEQFFQREGLSDFLDSGFKKDNESMTFLHGMLTESALAEVQKELTRLRARFAALHEECVDSPMSQKHGIGMLVARRGWEPSVFRALRRR